MDESSQAPANKDAGRHPNSGERIVVVMSPEVLRYESRDEINLMELWSTLWRGRWLIMSITAIFAGLSLAYVVTATQWYRGEVLLTPADAKSTEGLSDRLSGLGSLGGLVGLAGISIGGGSTVEPLAVLTSRDFTRAFIIDEDLLPILFADDWDAKAGRWKASDPKKWPDIHDAIKYFNEDIRRVREDKKTKLVTLTIEWTDPQVAAEWANLLVKRLNDRMRQRSLQEAESNVTYLKKELTEANVVTLQQAVGRLLESEMQKAMLARVNEEFAFRVIDRAEAPKWRSWPKRAQIMSLAVMVGLLLGCLVVLVRYSVQKSEGAVG